MVPYKPSHKPSLVRQSYEAEMVLKDMKEEMLNEQCNKEYTHLEENSGQEAIRYPSASKMRMWLASDGQTLPGITSANLL